ncbi:MAG: ECF transporter S component [Candidatus Methanofastidiosia archaeon]
MKGRQVVLSILMVLVVAGVTLFPIPIPATKLSFNLSESFIYLSAILFGARVGGFAGGVGSSLAVLILNSGNFIPITFLVKGLEGIVCGKISEGRGIFSQVMACLVSGFLMVALFFFTEFLISGRAYALYKLPFDVVQALSGLILAVPIANLLMRVPYIYDLREL